MPIKDLLVHLDQTPASEARLHAALTLAQRLEAHVTGLYLIAEPFLRGMVGHHMPDQIVREHLQHAEAEAEASWPRHGRRPSGTGSSSTSCARAARSTGCRSSWRAMRAIPI